MFETTRGTEGHGFVPNPRPDHGLPLSIDWEDIKKCEAST